MKLRITCMECFRIDGVPSDRFVPVEMTDDGSFVVTCDKGHVTLTALQQLKFEILFEFGAMALLDGYSREAISSMATALERCYELYIQVMCIKYGIEEIPFNESWKSVATLSERQFGAFLFLYLIDNKRPCPVINNDRPTIGAQPKSKIKPWIEFRNAVVHKGYLPSTQEVLAYGDMVYQFLNMLIRELKLNNREALDRVVSGSIRGKIIDGKPLATLSIPTLVSLNRGDAVPATFEDALKELREYRKWLHHK